MNTIKITPHAKAIAFLVMITLFTTRTEAQNEVAIGSATTKSNAILWLNGNGSQGLILPTVTNKSAVNNPDQGMIVYDNSDNKVWYRNNSAWVEVGGGSGGGDNASLNLLLSGNQLQLRDGTAVLNSVNIAGGTQTPGGFMVFQGGSWQFATLSGDVTGPNGALQVVGLRGKTIATLPASSQALVYDPAANSGAGGFVFQALSVGGGVTSITGTAPVTVAGTATIPIISLANAGITNALLADNAVTTAKIQDGTITGADIAATTITGGNIVNATITADKLAQSSATDNQVLQWNGTSWVPATLAGGGTVTQISTGTGLTGGPISNTGTISIAPGGVGTTELANNAVDATKLADNAVTTAKINANAVDNTKLADNAVSTLKLQDNAITSIKIVDATITGTDIAPTTITGGNIVNASITTDKLAQSSATDNQVLQWNGTSWVPATLAGGGTVTQINTGTGLTGGPISNTGTISIAAGGVGTTELANNAVDATKLADNAVTTLKIADNAVTTAKINANAVDATKLADNAVTTVKITASAVDNTKLADNAVTPLKLADNAVTTAKINANAVDNTKLADNAVSTVKLQDNAITSIKIVDATITGIDIAPTTITGGNIVNASITTDKLAQSSATDNQVLQWNGTSWVPATLAGGGTVTQINTGTGLTGGPISNTGTISIAPGGVGTTELANNAVDATKLADNAVTTVKINANAVDATKLADNAVTTAKINASAVDNTKLADNAVTTLKVANNAITSAKIADGEIINADISPTAAIAVTKLTAGTDAQVLTTVAGVPTWQTPVAGVTTLDGLTDVTVTTPASGQILVNNGAGQFINAAVSGDATVANTGALTIANNAVTTTKLAANAVDNTKLADNAVTTVKINANAVDNTKLADNAVTNLKIADNAITSAKIADGTIIDIDVANNAAIAVTKLAAGTDNQVLTTVGGVPAWQTAVSNDWSLTGNAGTNPAANFIGTTDIQPLRFATGTGGIERMRISETGNVGIGTTTPNAPLQFATSLANRKIVLFEGANNDHEYFGFGINSAELRYQTDKNSSHVFYSGVNSTTSAELMRIQSDGNVGIGTLTPGAKLDINGDLKITDGTQGDFKVLTSDATGLSTWNDLGSRPGNSNTAGGAGTFTSNTSGIYNTAFGNRSLTLNTTGQDNTALGAVTMELNTTGSNNTAIGSGALNVNTAGSNTSVGAYSMSLNTSGANNTVVGAFAGRTSNPANANTTGSENTFIGANSGSGTSTQLTNATAIGANALVSASNRMVLGVPGTAIQFDGEFRPADNPGLAGQVLTSAGPGGAPTWSSAGGGGFSTLNTIPKGDGSTLIASQLFDNGTNVGIGTVSPNDKLQVEGNINISTGSKYRVNGRTIVSWTADNFLLGDNSGLSLTTAQFNTTVGDKALQNLTTGRANVAIGVNSQQLSTTSIDQVSIGVNSLPLNTTGNYNTTVGAGSLRAITTASDYNTAIGWHAGITFTSGNFNTFLGETTDAANGLTNATAIGSKAFVTQSNSIVLGSINGTNTATSNTRVGIGTTAPAASLDVVGNIKITDGSQANGRVLTSDANGLASWQPAGAGTGWTLSGNSGTVDGSNYIGTNDNIPFNIRVNNQRAGRIDHIRFNAFYGQFSGNAITTGTSNTAIGHLSLSANTVGVENTAIGFKALESNTTSGLNTAVGKSALFSMNFANGGTAYISANTAIGYHSLYLTNPSTNSNGARNTALGYFAGYENTTGTNNVFIGYDAGPPTGVGNLTNAIAIGYNSTVSASNSMVLGGIGVDAVSVGIGTTTPSNILHVTGDVGGASTIATLEGHSATASRGPGISLLRSKGTVASPVAVSDGDYLGGFSVSGRTASAYNLSSAIQFNVDGAVAGTSVPGRITFSTTLAGSSTFTERMRITNAGNVGIGTAAPANRLSVAGGTSIGGGYTGTIAPTNGLIVQGNVGIGIATPNASLQLANILSNRRIVMWESANNDHEFYGFGVVSGQLRYQIPNNTGAAHIFYAATGSGSSLGLMSIGQNGNVSITGSLSKGSGTFKIDHPADPENKFLYHSFVESPDMMNVYNGNIETDIQGNATVTLPSYFEALNRDFRYQLTVIGQFAQAIVMEEISDNKFVIKTDRPNVKVSWQITGVRKDPFAEKNRVIPEVEKSPEEKGKYLHPEAYGQPQQKKIGLENN